MVLGLIKSLDNEREEISQRSKALAVEESKLSAERASLEQERDFVNREQERLNVLAKKIQSEMIGIESFSKVSRV